MRIDFHSHILPNIDDGAKDVFESVEMLRKLYNDGVETVVLTPHFYRNKSNIESFLIKRSNSFQKLNDTIIHYNTFPKLLQGCECYYYPSLFEDDFSKLCIEGTDFLLLELPFEKFSDRFLLTLQNSINKSKCKIILAHVERYLEYNSIDTITGFINENDILCQMNCCSLANANIFHRKKLLKLIDQNIVQLLGSDAHNLKKRPPRFSEAEYIIKKHNINNMNRLNIISKMVINNEQVDKILSI